MKKKVILITSAILIVIVILYLKSYAYLPIKGTVIDAETGKPIEGAVILAEWTITKGVWIGLPTTESYKAVETSTDESGNFKIDTIILRPFINKPYLTIYKAGYVCWNNQYIFPDYKQREDFKWESGRKYPLEIFRKEYTYENHVSFIRNFIIPGFKNIKQPFIDAYRWEEIMEHKELRGKK